MSIKVGDTIPKAAINVIKDGIQATDTATFFAGKKVVLFAVPGAFTPTCSAKHMPGFIAHKIGRASCRKEGVSTCRSRCAPYHIQQNTTIYHIDNKPTYTN